MSYEGLIGKGVARSAPGARILAMGLALSIAAGATSALAQAAPPAAPAQKAPAAAPAAGKDAPKQATAPAAGKDAPKQAAAPAAAGEKKNAWVKLCEKAPFAKKGEDGKETKEEKNICLTHHERLDGNTGMVLVSAAIREVEGSSNKQLMMMVPFGMALPPGIKVYVHDKATWDKASKNETIDYKTLKSTDLKYSVCIPAGCTAEIDATPEIIDQMKTGGGMVAIIFNAGGQPIALPVPLDGFSEALAGKPIDSAVYKEKRGQLMAQIRERQKAAIEKYKSEKANQADALKQLPTDVPGAPPTTTGSTPATKVDKK